jgi:hypothetical protein
MAVKFRNTFPDNFVNEMNLRKIICGMLLKVKQSGVLYRRKYTYLILGEN